MIWRLLDSLARPARPIERAAVTVLGAAVGFRVVWLVLELIAVGLR